jgi:hypothetical protein
MADDAHLALVRTLDARRALLGDAGLDALREHEQRLRAHAPEQAHELAALARACGREAHELLLLDGGLVEVLTRVGIERSLGLHVEGSGGSILAGAWALPHAEAEQVALRATPAGAWRFGLPGSFGLAGIARAGHVVITNVMRPAALGSGIVGSALLDQMLHSPDLAHARARLESTKLVDGRNWMLGDGQAFLGFEQLGDACLLTRVGHKAGHVHANHCFDPSLRAREAVPRDPVSFRRLELASTIYVQRRPMTVEAVLDYFDEVEQAAFADEQQRARTVMVVELSSRTVLWRSHAGAAPQREVLGAHA